MPSSELTRESAIRAPHRVLALGGAVTITAMAVAGSLGIGPGAPAGTAAASPQDAGPAVQRTVGQTGAEASSGPQSDRWLTIAPPSGGATSSGGAGPSDSATSSDSGTPPDNAGSPPGGPGMGSADAARLPADSGSGRRVVYDISAQRVWLVNADGGVERTYLVSGSRQQDLLAPATYTVDSRSRHAVSFNSKETMNYMVRFAYGDHFAIGFHDIPTLVDDGSLAQSLDDLGTPQSAGCIRQREADAKALWQFAGIDTTVVVTA